jgi:hypothetical protein
MKNEEQPHKTITKVKNCPPAAHFSLLTSHFSLKSSTFAAAFERCARFYDGAGGIRKMFSINKIIIKHYVFRQRKEG